MTGIDYRRAAFNLMTFGSDDVVRAYNKLMQTFFNRKPEHFKDNIEYGEHILRVFSDLLLTIRKDLYTKRTRLKRSEMIEFMLTDIENHRKQIDKDKL